MVLTEEKKIKGRKRHIVVDIMGNLLAVEEDAASFLGIEVEISEKITPNKFHILLSHRLNTGKKSKVIFLDRITSFDKNLKIFFQLFNRLGNT